jgi:phosphoglycolate phosphatase
VKKLAIFDSDGTMDDSGATIHRALSETFDRHGLEIPPARESRKVIGLSLTQAMAALLPEAADADHAELAETYKGCFHQARRNGLVEEPLFDGILELLDSFETEGWLLAVATGKSDRGLRLCLESHGLHPRFLSLQTADRHPSKPSPSMALAAMADAGATPAKTVVIGDTSYDMGMAVAAGATGIGAGWGYHDETELIAAGAVAVANDPAEVMAIAREAVNG